MNQSNFFNQRNKRIKQIITTIIFLFTIGILSGCITPAESWNVEIHSQYIYISYDYEYGWSDEVYYNIHYFQLNYSDSYQISIDQQGNNAEYHDGFPLNYEIKIINMIKYTIQVQLNTDPTLISPFRATKTTITLERQIPSTMLYIPIATVIITWNN